MTTLLNGWALLKLTERGRNTNAIPAGWWWLAFTFLMGWLGFARVDGLTAPLVLVALAYGVASARSSPRSCWQSAPGSRSGRRPSCWPSSPSSRTACWWCWQE